MDDSIKKLQSVVSSGMIIIQSEIKAESKRLLDIVSGKIAPLQKEAAQRVEQLAQAIDTIAALKTKDKALEMALGQEKAVNANAVQKVQEIANKLVTTKKELDPLSTRILKIENLLTPASPTRAVANASKTESKNVIEALGQEITGLRQDVTGIKKTLELLLSSDAQKKIEKVVNILQAFKTGLGSI